MYNCWKFITKREVTFGREYVKFMEDELAMAVVFDYKEALEIKMLELSLGEGIFETLVDLIEVPWEMEVEGNVCLRVFNS